MKKSLALLLCLLLVLTVAPISSQDSPLAGAVVMYVSSNGAIVNGTDVKIDDDFTVTPYVENGTTLIPLRFLAQSLGCEVEWNGETQTAVLTRGENVISVTVASDVMDVDGNAVSLGAAAAIRSDRTFVPLRAICEALGKTVFYDRGLIVVSDKEVFNESTDKAVLDNIIRRVNVLPAVGSAENFKKYFGSDASRTYVRGGAGGASSNAAADMGAPMEAPMAEKQAFQEEASYDSATGEAGYSETNLQTAGVDEADIVKTDGTYLYTLSDRQIVITKAYPAADMAVASKITFGNENISPNEMYIDGNTLIVIAGSYREVPYQYTDRDGNVQDSVRHESITLAMVYDISDRTNPSQVREFTVDGNYQTSRKIGNSFYLISQKWVYSDDSASPLPIYRDGAEEKAIGYDDMRCFPYSRENSMIMLAGINLANPAQEADVQSYVGASSQVYVSTQNMYITVPHYEYEERTDTDWEGKEYTYQAISSVTTDIYKFSLDAGRITYLAAGNVAGTVLNQFSMDEYDGYLRIATTTNAYKQEEQSQNSLFVLDETLSPVGNVSGLAEGERIYSVRFMGDKAYVVTFKNTDPLFVLNLSDPTAPVVEGELKIPGYNNYLHPYDETHLIGIGMDTREDGDRVYTLGMKLTMFDVTDINNPVEMFTEYIGDAGTESPVLYNHKALVFSKEKGLLGFPVTLREAPGEKFNAEGYPNYGELTFQGALMFQVDLENGFTRLCQAGQIPEENKEIIKDYGYVPYNREVQRILYIDDCLYTISQRFIYAHDLATGEDLNFIDLKD